MGSPPRRSGDSRLSERGQAAVEFTIFAAMLLLAIILIVQLSWIGIQKWQFNHFASYSARVWSVHKDQEPGDALRQVQIRALLRWNLASNDYVKLMWVKGEGSKDYHDPDVTANGITYLGAAPLLSIFRQQIGETLFSNPIPAWAMSLFSGLDIPSTGLVGFETFIPIDKEPEEQPGSDRDNDCNETPCESGNKR
jgi:TadE-like protein